ncbi:MAG: hypothetical protein CM1200mP29_13760 [Verrucomicrobiota bacterium]|nr:MAG: hypothetical protein CM1200mP29_13760 [Verrucomicrobiota bacterium]
MSAHALSPLPKRTVVDRKFPEHRRPEAVRFASPGLGAATSHLHFRRHPRRRTGRTTGHARVIQANAWPSGVNLFVCPCLNPTGFQKNTRENQDGIDLNRDYRYIKTCEVQAHTKWIDSLPTLDFGICLHEDWEARGFYLYELNPDNLPAVSKDVIDAIDQTCPIDHSERIDDRPASGGILKPVSPPRRGRFGPRRFTSC